MCPTDVVDPDDRADRNRGDDAICTEARANTEREFAARQDSADPPSRWLDAYLAAWKSYDRNQIAALFSDDVTYRYHPYDDPVRRRDEVVASWLGEGEHTGASTAILRAPTTPPIGRSPSTATWPSRRATPSTWPRPADRSTYENCFVLRFDATENLCHVFTDWYIQHPGPPTRTTTLA